MKKLTITIHGEHESDLETALQEVQNRINGGFMSGHDHNETGKFEFEIEYVVQEVENEMSDNAS